MKPQFGIVAILDALGVSSYSIEEANQFISQKEVLLKEISDNHSPAIAKIYNDVVLKAKPERKFPEVNISLFGDTIIICWPTDSEEEALEIFPGISTLLQNLIALGIIHGILLRGAVSIGEYLNDGKSTILGPAISDAYSWSEEADWSGVILTPYLRMAFGFLLESNTLAKSNKDLWCILYPVPLHNERKEFYVIPWPKYFIDRHKATSQFPNYAGLCKLLSRKPIPKGTESKYENTLAFFKWYENHCSQN